MSKNEIVRSKLFDIYGSSILCGMGNNQDIRYNIGNIKNYSFADIAIYIHQKSQIAVVWNIKWHREMNCEVKTISLSKKWEDLSLDYREIKKFYKKMGTSAKAPKEKVLIMSIATLELVLYELADLLQFDVKDSNFPQELQNEKKLLLHNEICLNKVRKRISTSQWERDTKFRKMILARYKNKCAICRCDEEKILQAAHIQAVADDGNDEPQNGICLCANHHLMLDRELIKIDYTKLTLSYVADTVKKMSWYNIFINKYKGLILKGE